MGTVKMKENEFIQWRKDQIRLLNQQSKEEKTLKESQKRLKTINKEITKNNNWLRKQ